jgi:hypothetical protein
MQRIRIHAAAAEEVAEAAAWYEKERPGLGAEFQQAIEAALDLLEEELVPLMPVRGAAIPKIRRNYVAVNSRRPRHQAPPAQAFPLRCDRSRGSIRGRSHCFRAHCAAPGVLARASERQDVIPAHPSVMAWILAPSHLTVAVARIERGRDGNAIDLSRFCHVPEKQRASATR